MLPYCLIKPLVFSLAPETAHELTIGGLRRFGSLLPKQAPPEVNPVQVMGITFPNRIGLAAGLDKNGEAIEAWGTMGFAFVEIGTVTPRPQTGNPRPRLFRLPEVEGVINRMGFNNQGIDVLIHHVQAARQRGFRGILGINIGKNADTPIERAVDDYLIGLERAYPWADYITVNISSPNTKNLRQLQGESELDGLLAALQKRQTELTQQYGRHVPITLKIAPDLDDGQLAHIADALRRHRIDGVIATNTTLSRDGVEHLPHGKETGGLSGAPVFERSTAVLKSLARALQGEVPIIAAGGVTNGERARAKLAAGASLVQIYSGLVYRGPGLIRECIDACC